MRKALPKAETRLRELDEHITPPLKAILYWEPTEDSTVISVSSLNIEDPTYSTFEVPRDRAKEALHHVYPYAPKLGKTAIEHILGAA